MMETRRLELRYGHAVICEMISVVRNHHDSMPGESRNRPGWDRVRLRLPDKTEAMVDLWSRPEQDIEKAPARIEVYDQGDLVCWRGVVSTPS